MFIWKSDFKALSESIKNISSEVLQTLKYNVKTNETVVSKILNLQKQNEELKNSNNEIQSSMKSLSNEFSNLQKQNEELKEFMKNSISEISFLKKENEELKETVVALCENVRLLLLNSVIDKMDKIEKFEK